MDKLFKTATFYKENLLNRQFYIKAGKNRKILEFNIIFSAKEFKHLSGLHKLTDLPKIKQNKSESLLRQILNKQLTYEHILHSQFLQECDMRLDYFADIKQSIFSNNIIIKSLHGHFNTISADIMFTNKNNYGYAHFFVKYKTEKTVFPVTFIVHDTNSYLQNNPYRWTVLEAKEIVNKNSKDKAYKI